MSLIIPVENDAAKIELQAVLDGETYTLYLEWNVRQAAWFLTVRDAEGTADLHTGARLVADWPLWAYVADRRPPGALMAIDTSGNGEDPGLDDLGDRVQLTYFSAEELGL